MWERLRQEVEVAVYVRQAVRAWQPDARAADGVLRLRMADSLGLTLNGLLRNRWRIETEAEAPSSRRPVDPDRAAAKAKLRLLADRAAGG
jgi:hypothetical protein